MKPRILPSHLQRAHTTKISLFFSPGQWVMREKADIRYWRIRYPSLASIDYETTVYFFCGRFHSRRVGSMIRFSESLGTEDL